MDITSYDQIEECTQRWVLIDFYAPWCKPCQRIEPFIEQLRLKWTHVFICKASLECVPELHKRYDVMVLPTFILFKKDDDLTMVGKVMGTNPDKLIELLKLSRHQE